MKLEKFIARWSPKAQSDEMGTRSFTNEQRLELIDAKLTQLHERVKNLSTRLGIRCTANKFVDCVRPRLEEQNAALGTRISQFQFCINRIAEALGNVCCGGVDSSPEEQMADPHSTTRVLCDAITKLQKIISLQGAALAVWKSGKANKPGIAFDNSEDEKDFVASLKNRDGL